MKASEATGARIGQVMAGSLSRRQGRLGENGELAQSAKVADDLERKIIQERLREREAAGAGDGLC